jgi:hypothetical protein
VLQAQQKGTQTLHLPSGEAIRDLIKADIPEGIKLTLINAINKDAETRETLWAYSQKVSAACLKNLNDRGEIMFLHGLVAGLRFSQHHLMAQAEFWNPPPIATRKVESVLIDRSELENLRANNSNLSIKTMWLTGVAGAEALALIGLTALVFWWGR